MLEAYLEAQQEEAAGWLRQKCRMITIPRTMLQISMHMLTTALSTILVSLLVEGSRELASESAGCTAASSPRPFRQEGRWDSQCVSESSHQWNIGGTRALGSGRPSLLRFWMLAAAWLRITRKPGGQRRTIRGFWFRRW